MNCEMQATNVLQQDGSRTITWYAGGLQSFREMPLGPVRRRIECGVDAVSASWCSNKQNGKSDKSDKSENRSSATQMGTVLQTL